MKKGDSFLLRARKKLDREEKKEYDIPVKIADNLGLGATSVLRLVVGDRNDNPMEAGSSEIFVYNYEVLYIVLYCIVLYCIVLYCIVLYCIVL